MTAATYLPVAVLALASCPLLCPTKYHLLLMNSHGEIDSTTSTFTLILLRATWSERQVVRCVSEEGETETKW